MSQSKSINPYGIVLFRTLPDALRAGYQVYDRTDDGYLVRTRTEGGWALAFVHVTSSNARLGM